MLLKTFKQNCMSECEFEVNVHNETTDKYESFIVNYLADEIEKSNLSKLRELYDKKAILKDVHYNKAIQLITVWCTIK